MAASDTGLVEEALRRFTPAIVALTTETRELVDVSPVLQFMAKDTVAWKSIFVIDRFEVCQWFVQNVSDPALASCVSEVKAQLPTPEGSSAPDAHLTAMCIKHRIIAIAVGREKARRAEIAAAEAEFNELVAQLMEDGMGEREAAAEAQRTIDANADEPEEDEDLAPVRDIVIIKGFPNHAHEINALARMGVSVNVVIAVNSLARFGRKDDFGFETKDGKTIKKRPEQRKPDNKKGKGGRDESDRLEPLTVQVVKELGKVDAFESNPLRDTLFWTYEIQSVEGALADDGTKTYISTESEGVSCDAVSQALFKFVEKVYRYREWVIDKSYIRVPKLKVRDPPEIKAVVQVPTPSPSATSKVNQKKQKVKAEPEIVKEEIPVLPSVPELHDSVYSLPTPLDLFDTIASSAAGSLGAGTYLTLFGSLIQAAHNASVSGKSTEPATVSVQTSTESQAAEFMDDMFALLEGTTASRVQERETSRYGALAQELPAESPIKSESAANSFMSLSEPSTSFGGKVMGVDMSRIVNPLLKVILDSAFRHDQRPVHEKAIISLMAAVGSQLRDKEAKQITSFEVLSDERLAEYFLKTAARSELEGFETAVLSNTTDGIGIIAKRSAPTTHTLPQHRFRSSWYLFQGRVPFPLWSSFEDTYQNERAHYYPPMQDEEDPIPEEEEEEDDEFDEEGNLIPKKAKIYEITYQNVADLSAKLVQRRAVFDTLGQFLKRYPSEVLQANNHGSTVLMDEHACLYPEDGSCISVHNIRGNSSQVACCVHDSSASSVFGFHTTKNPPLHKSSLSPLESDGPQRLYSSVRAFGTHVNGMHFTIETYLYDSSSQNLHSPARAEQSPLAENIQLNQPPPGIAVQSGKRSGTPRSKLNSAIVSGFSEDIQQNNQSVPAPSLGRARSEVPTSVITMVIDDNTMAQVTHSDITLSMTGSTYTVTVASSVLSTLTDEVINCIVCHDKSILLVGKQSRLKLFASGDIATYFQGVWLLTSISTGGRVVRNDSSIIPLDNVLMATTISDGITTVSRDDGVDIVSKPDVIISLPGNVRLLKVFGETKSTFLMEKGTKIIFDEDTTIVELANGCVLVHDGTSCLMGSTTHPFKAVFSFSSYRLYVTPTAYSPAYHIDCVYGGLRVHDDKNAFHVTPLGRYRQVAKEVESRPIPVDLTVKHTVDVFIEEPEVANVMFEALAAGTGWGVGSSLQVQKNLNLPNSVNALFQMNSPRSSQPTKSLYQLEKSARYHEQLNGVLREFSPTPLSPWLTNVYVRSTFSGKGFVSVSKSHVSESVASAKLSDPILSNVSSALVDDTQFTQIVRCTSRSSQSLSTSEVRTFSKFSPTATFNVSIPPIDKTLASVVNSIPKPILAQLDTGLALQVPKRVQPAAPSRSESKVWPSPIATLHVELDAVRRQEIKYWPAAGGVAQQQLSYLPQKSVPKAIEKAEMSSDISPHKPRSQPQQRPYLNRKVSENAAEGTVTTFTNPQPPESIKRPTRRVLVPTPSEIQTGAVMAEVRYGATIQLTNVSTSICRFRATCPAPWVALQYKMAPLAAGMTTPLEVEINGTQPLGDAEALVTVAHEGGSFTVPIFLQVHPPGQGIIVSPQAPLRALGHV